MIIKSGKVRDEAGHVHKKETLMFILIDDYFSNSIEKVNGSGQNTISHPA